MNVKAVVKVMNFHALLRVDAARRQAETYGAMEEELEAMMRIVLNNRNLQLDQCIKMPDPNLPVLRIYLGSDFGFCGSVNTAVSGVLAQDANNESEKVVVGKKLRKPPEVALYLTQEEFSDQFSQVLAFLDQAVRKRPWSGVELVYNHYYNLSSIKQIVRRIYPLEALPDETENKWDDFVLEGDPTQLLEEMSVAYLEYEVRIAAASAYAAENIMRQNATSESLKKLDEIEEEERRQTRKAKNQLAFQKTIDSYVKQKSLGGT